MLETSFGLIFFLRKPRPENQEGTHYLYCRITVNGIAKEFSLKQLWHPAKWNVRAGRANGSREDARTLNAFIDSLTSKIYQVKRRMIDDDREISAEAIFNIIHGKLEKTKSILSVFVEHNKDMAALVGADFAPGTLCRYQTSMDHTSAFIRWKYQQDDFELSRLDYDFISSYEFWLKTVRKCSHNTSMKYLANFKKIVLLCIKKGWLKRDPFSTYKMTKREVDREALTETELQVIKGKDLGEGRLSYVKDIFLFCCYTGLAYADVYKLRREEVIVGIDGGKWIVTKRQKTESPSRIPLLPTALDLLEKYSHCKSSAKSGHL